MTDTLKIGDTVFLNSGSPPMRVENIRGDWVDVSWTTWVDASWTTRVDGQFPRNALRCTDIAPGEAPTEPERATPERAA